MTTKTCCIQGCNEPRTVSKGGTVMTRCREHLREYWQGKASAKRKPGEAYSHRATSAKRKAAATDTLTVLDDEDLPDGYRRCGQCRQVKPNADFQRHGVTFRGACRACSAARTLEAEMSKSATNIQIGPVQTPSRVLLVDRERGQIILCQIYSEIPADARHVDMIIEFYERQGYRIVDAVERVEAIHEHAN